jgi:hypothetical protein
VARASKQKDKRKRLGARVWLQLDGEKRTSGILLSTAEIGVLIREDAKPGVVVLLWSEERSRWGFVGPTED